MGNSHTKQLYKVMIASLGSLPDLKVFKYDRELEETKTKKYGYSHHDLKSNNSNYSHNPYDSDSTSEVSIFSCPFCLHICNIYDEGIKVMLKQCEQTIADQNFNLNDAEPADVDVDENMDIDEEEQNCPICQKLFRTKDKIEQHFIFH